MKKTLKTFICIILCIALFAAIACNISAVTVYNKDGFAFTYPSSATASVYGWANRSDKVIIPKEVNEHYIVDIRDSAFQNNTYITTVDFSKAIILDRIGYYAFAGCTGLTGSIVLGGRIETLGASAFMGCSSLSEVNMTSRMITTISDQCFYNCSTLSSVTLPENLVSINKLAFANCIALEQITIPKAVTKIDPTAFSNINDLVINCYTDSYAQSFAEENGIEYVLIDAPTPTEPVTEPITEPATEVVTEPSTQEPTSATEPSTDPTEPKAPYMLGDADNSGDIDVIDATFVQRYSIEAFIPCEDTIMYADVDSSGDVSSIDATFILRHLIHISVGYPIGEYVS